MAETDTLPKPDAKPPLSDSTTGSFEDFLSKQTERNQARGDELMGQVKDVTGRIKEIDKGVDALKPPDLIPMPQRPDIRQNNPLEAFGSAAGWLAVFGGFLTKRPLQTALNASAGVMNAVRERDYEQAKFSMNEWKVASANAEAMNKFQVDTYKQALAKLGENRKDAIAELQSYTAAFKDVTGSDLLSARMYSDFQRHVVALEHMENERQKNGPTAWENWARQDLYKKLEAAQTPQERAQIQQQIGDFNRTFPAHGGAQVTAAENRRPTASQQRAEAQQSDASSVVGQMKDLITMLKNSPKALSGVGGMMSRAGETIQTAPILKYFSKAGSTGDVDLTASKFKSQLELVKAQLPPLLGKTGRISNYERSQIDRAISALESGATDAKSIEAINGAIKILTEKFGLKEDGSPDPEKAVVEDPAAGLPSALRETADRVLDALYGGASQ